MENKFVNSHVYSEPAVKEIQRYIVFFRPFRIVFNLILFLCFLFDLIYTIMGGYMNSFALVFVPLFYAYEIFVYFRAVSMTIKRNREMNYENNFVTYEITDDSINFTAANGAKSSVEFSNIKSVRQTKNFIVLMSEARLLHILKKDGFSLGTCEEFKVFLREKGYKIK